MGGMKRLAAAAVLCLQIGMWPAQSQSTRAEDLGPGKLLVATPELGDPNFAKTVVMLVQFDDDGVVGLILNRRSKVAVSRVLEEVQAAKGRHDPVYAGGPVGRTEVLALVRATEEPAGAKRVSGDLFLAVTKESLEKTLTGTEAADIHFYLGYAGWTAEQLENEVAMGGWYIFPGNAKAVFDAAPESLWDRLIRLTETRIALGFRSGVAAAYEGGGSAASCAGCRLR